MQTIPALSRFFRSANSFRRSFEIENFSQLCSSRSFSLFSIRIEIRDTNKDTRIQRVCTKETDKETAPEKGKGDEGRECEASQKGGKENFIGSDLAPPNVYSFASQIFICFHPLGKLGRYTAIGISRATSDAEVWPLWNELRSYRQYERVYVRGILSLRFDTF